MNLREEEIVKFAYLGHSNNPESAVDVLKRSLAMRNKYAIFSYSILANSIYFTFNVLKSP